MSTTLIPYPAFFGKERSYETLLTDPYDLITPYFVWFGNLRPVIMRDYLSGDLFDWDDDEYEDYTFIQK